MSEERENKGITFPKGTKSECVQGINYGEQGTFIKGNIYDHPENNCVTDGNGKELFIPHTLIHCFKPLKPITNGNKTEDTDDNRD